MTHSDEQEENEPELDPAVESVRRKLMWLLASSFGILLLGMLAVAAGVVYRVQQSDSAAEPAEVTAAKPIPLAVPVDDILSASISGERMLLVMGGSSPRIEVRRLSDGALLSEFALEQGAE